MKTDLTVPILLLIFGMSIVFDLRWRKIPNWLTGFSIIIGLGLHTFMNQLAGFVFSLGGVAVGLGLFLGMYLVGCMGAGDVKLFGAVGSFLGPAQTISAALVIGLVGAVVALVTLGFHQGWRKTGLWLWAGIQSMFLTRSFLRLAPVQGEAPKVPYAVAIGLGTIVSCWWHPLG